MGCFRPIRNLKVVGCETAQELNLGQSLKELRSLSKALTPMCTRWLKSRPGVSAHLRRQSGVDQHLEQTTWPRRRQQYRFRDFYSSGFHAIRGNMPSTPLDGNKDQTAAEQRNSVVCFLPISGLSCASVSQAVALEELEEFGIVLDTKLAHGVAFLAADGGDAAVELLGDLGDREA